MLARMDRSLHQHVMRRIYIPHYQGGNFNAAHALPNNGDACKRRICRSERIHIRTHLFISIALRDLNCLAVKHILFRLKIPRDHIAFRSARKRLNVGVVFHIFHHAHALPFCKSPCKFSPRRRLFPHVDGIFALHNERACNRRRRQRWLRRPD